ncbi:TIGR03618 family F420-dependent PPOX class oxidoreductase [Mycobacterium sp. 21AC1]|uniref:TIGR03618 family F420-dependent PPOX class oxidoreductase n=1 Tax=[Mycobacterium] appelbergii TaxID=2939269 RepID=UPI002938F3C4|nr:TIGR03618 family F420-dependent PPOX class oxidoreductase [Mycobacterium sp. 21AC1]MDV3130318.1 TIGR03618 family F420-dependent PPOX class oxidoreductase [Mycobacterium sp. 21AC1]
MMTTIPAAAMHLLRGKYYAHVATTNTDGTPQISQVWVSTDGDLITFNCYESSVKARNLRANPSVAVSIAGHGNTSHESLAVQGKVVEMTHAGAEQHIDALANHYLGLDAYPIDRPEETRVIVKIAPQKVYHRVGYDVEKQYAQTMAPYTEQIRHLLDKNMRGWVDTFAEDAVLELPYAPANYPQRLEGKAAIFEYVKDYPKHIDLRDISELAVHQTLDPKVLVVEAVVEGLVVATGNPYRVRYVWVITVEAGKVVRQRDYWNPVSVLDALGGDEVMRDAFNVQAN